MVQEVNETMFRDAMNLCAPKSFSYYGQTALFDYLDSTDWCGDDFNPKDVDMCWAEISLDTEASLILNDYGYLVEDDNDYTEEDDMIEAIISELEDKTSVIRVQETNSISPDMNVNSIIICTDF